METFTLDREGLSAIPHYHLCVCGYACKRRFEEKSKLRRSKYIVSSGNSSGLSIQPFVEPRAALTLHWWDVFDFVVDT